jgi:hypothetical protein
MAGVGDAAAHKYVIHEMIRRTIGAAGKRSTAVGQLDTNSVDNLKNWPNLKAPWIRMCSNAVPRVDIDGNDVSSQYAEYTDAKALFGEAPSNITRFSHVLYGGLGQVHSANSAEVTIERARSFFQNYINPYNHGKNLESDVLLSPENRLRPAPGITNLDVTYKGDMGALKRATVAFKCHTLDDLERMEKFYMYPGIKVLVEWGWSINTAGTEYASAPITGVPLGDDTLKSPAKVYAAIQAEKVKSGGCYDGLFGTIINFNWSLNSDKSFDCITTLADIGDSIFTANINTPFHTMKKKAADEAKSDDGGFTLLAALKEIDKKLNKQGKDNQVSSGELPFKESIGLFKCKFYNLVTGDTSKASDTPNKTNRSKQVYIRFGDIVDRLCNKLYAITSKHTRAAAGGSTYAPPLTMLSIGGSNSDQDDGLSSATITTVEDLNTQEQMHARPITVISNHPQLISCNPGICLLPNQVGTSNEYKVKEKKSYAPTGLNGNGIDFNVPNAAADGMGIKPPYNREKDYGAGFLANIFVNTKMLVAKADTADSLADFLNAVTTDINIACGNIWAFQWRMSDDHPGYMTCVDRNFNWSGKIEALEFGIDNLTSLVRSFSMKSSISKEMTNHLFIAANSPLTGKTVDQGELSNKNIIPLDVDFEIDGVSGLQFGTVLAIDYLPKRYRAQTYLFAKQVQHSITPSNWTTTITAGFRWAPKEDDLKKIRLSQVIDNLVGNEADIADKITLNELDAKIVPLEQVQSTTAANLPGSMFASLESEGLMMGSQEDDPEKGMEVETGIDDQEDRTELITKLTDIMSKIYLTGGTTNSINDASSILSKILYYAAEEGEPVPPNTEAVTPAGAPVVTTGASNTPNANTDV